MGEYLKMADVFNGDVNVSNVYGFILYTGSIYDDSTICEHAAAFDNESAVYISNAINSHDELVAEVERLRDMVIRMQTYLDMAGEYPEKESDNPVRQWLFDAIDCTK